MYGLLYNVFCCWMVTIIGGTAARHIMLYRDRHAADRAFGVFWFFAAGLWFFAGLRLIFYYFGQPALDRYTFYLVQFFVLFHLAPGVAYIVLKIIPRGRAARLTLVLMIPFFIGFIFFLFFDGVKSAGFSSWGSEFSISPRTFWCFLPAFVICFFGSVYYLFAQIVSGLRGRPLKIENFLGSFAILLYCLVGIFDAKGVLADWRFLLIRGTLVLSALLSFTGYSWETETVFLDDATERSDF